MVNFLKESFIPDLYKYLTEVDKVSMAALQRRLRIGYCRAGRIIDNLSKMGIVKDDMSVVKEKVETLSNE